MMKKVGSIFISKLYFLVLRDEEYDDGDLNGDYYDENEGNLNINKHFFQ